MIKILYVDPLSPPGHINFNNIYISAFGGIKNLQVDFLFQEGYREKLNIPFENKCEFFSYGVKRSAYNGLLNKIVWRLHQLSVLHVCKKLFRKSKYDYIFFSSFDEISLLLSGFIGKRVIAVCHANAEHIPNSRLSLLAHKIIAHKGTLITLNNALSNYMSTVGIKNTFVPHGLPKVEKENSINSRTIFIPAKPDICDKGIMASLVSEKVSRVLGKYNVQLILKENPSLPHNLPNINFTDRILSKQEYMKLYQEAGLILLPYNKNTYVFRTSAMLMEAVAYKKNVAIPNAKSFVSLKKEGDIGIYIYDSAEDIIRIIECLFSTSTIPFPNYKQMEIENGEDVIKKSIEMIINRND